MVGLFLFFVFLLYISLCYFCLSKSRNEATTPNMRQHFSSEDDDDDDKDKKCLKIGLFH